MGSRALLGKAKFENAVLAHLRTSEALPGTLSCHLLKISRSLLACEAFSWHSQCWPFSVDMNEMTPSPCPHVLLLTAGYGNWEMQHLHEDGVLGGCEWGAGTHWNLPQEDIPWTLSSVSVSWGNCSLSRLCKGDKPLLFVLTSGRDTLRRQALSLYLGLLRDMAEPWGSTDS